MVRLLAAGSVCFLRKYWMIDTMFIPFAFAPTSNFAILFVGEVMGHDVVQPAQIPAPVHISAGNHSGRYSLPIAGIGPSSLSVKQMD